MCLQVRDSKDHYILSLRQIVVENGPASPFQQVLSWLSNREDYFTAASVALDFSDMSFKEHLIIHGFL